MNRLVSRVVFAFVVLSFAGIVSAQIVDQEAKLKSLPKLEKRPANEVHLFGTKMTVNVSIDAKGNVTAVNSVEGPGWVCPGVERPDVNILREAAKTAARKAKFQPAVLGGKRVDSNSVIEIEFPVRSTMAAVEGVNVRGEADTSSTATERKLKGEDQGDDIAISRGSSGAPPNPSERNALPKTLSDGPLNRTALEMPRPAYPAAARAVKASGSVRVEVLIGEDGKMLFAEPVSGHPLLRPASRIAACGARFTPVTLSGVPVKVRGFITYNYVP